MTRSCMRSVFEKQIVRRINRLIRVRRLMWLLSIFWVFAFLMLRGIKMSLVSAPAICVIRRDAKGL